MTVENPRSVELTRLRKARFVARNPRGGELEVGQGDDEAFSPVELLLAAIAACTAIDVDYITTKRVQPETFTVDASGEKLRDDSGNHMGDLRVEFTVTFPQGEDGDRARDLLPRAIQQTRDRLCTVGRTVALGEPVEYVEEDLSGLEISRR